MNSANTSLTNVAIVVPSCDKYSDLWTPLFQNLAITWPNNGLKTYLITNHKNFDIPGVQVIKVGDDITWSANLKNALRQVNEEYVFLLIDDLFFSKRVGESHLLPIVSDFVAKNGNYLRFNPTPGPTGPTDSNGIGQVEKGDYYRSSTVLAIWKKEVLFELLSERESAWEFEILGSTRTDKYDGWYASADWKIPYRNLVIKGKYDPCAYAALIKGGLALDARRPTMNAREYIIFLAIRLRAWVFKVIPRKSRRTIRDKFNAA